jgi:hypothetical protein
MALQLGALRDALQAAGAGPDKASAAAEEVASYEIRFADIRSDVATLRGDIRTEVANVRGDLRVLRIRLNILIGILSLLSVIVAVPSIGLLLRIAIKIGALS